MKCPTLRYTCHALRWCHTQGLRDDVATQDVKEIENAKQPCSKVVDQVSHTWETLMDDDQSQKIANKVTVI